MATYIYVDGKAVKVAGKPRFKGPPDVVSKSFNERLLDGYRQSEAAGHRWMQPWSKTFVKDRLEMAHKREASVVPK